MAIVLVATVGAADANAYLDDAAASVYFDSRLGATVWTLASVELRKAALISATNRLDQEAFNGLPTTATQRLKWPRAGAEDPDGLLYDDDIIPRCIQEAVCEIALVILADAGKLGGNDLDQFESLSVGSISLVMRGTTSNDLPAAAWRLVNHLLGAGGGQIRVMRG